MTDNEKKIIDKLIKDIKSFPLTKIPTNNQIYQQTHMFINNTKYFTMNLLVSLLFTLYLC